MASQCARPEFKAAAPCDAVRLQQQVEEEKRNPTLLN
jgi:Meckel syndrome type 1 protein